MSILMLDAGALIALERDSRRVWALVEAAFDAGDRVQVPACALAQVWTGAPTQARLNQALKRCRTISLDEEMARGASNYSLRAEVYFDDGESVYPLLAAQRSAIESECNLKLRWEPLEDARASRVAVYLDPANPADRAKRPEYRAWALGDC